MKKSALIGTALLSAATVAAGIGMIALPHAYASWEWRGYRGDLNHDGVVSMVDIVKMQRYLLRLDSLQGEDILQRADLNQDHVVNVTDLMMLKHCVLYEDFLEIWEEITDTTTVTSDTTAPVTTTTETTTTTTDTTDAEDATFLTPSIQAVKASLPSQGDAKLVIFYVDFPDCKYTTDLSAEQIQEIAFGEADTSDSNYPFDSMRAFYERSSKGTMHSDDRYFAIPSKKTVPPTIRTKNKLARECYDAFNDSVDFSQFDINNDGVIDATLFCSNCCRK